MRKYKIRVLAFIVLSMWFASEANAALLKEYTWSDKLGRGATNIVTCPVEVVRTIQVTSKEKGAGYGWTVGLLEGLGRTVLRLGLGVVDVVTCPFNFPEKDKGPLINPEYVWQKWDADYSADVVKA